MRKLFILFFSLWCALSFAQYPPPLNVTEEDSDPSVYPYMIKFQNGSITDNGDGTTTHKVDGDNIEVSHIGDSTYKYIQDAFNFVASTGQISGGIVTDVGSETINVSAGSGWIKAADNDTEKILLFDWSSSLGISIPTNERRFIGVIYNDGVPIIDSRVTDNYDLDTEFVLASVINENGVLHILQNPWWTSDGITNIVESLRSFGYLRKDSYAGGLQLSVTGTRNIAVSTGTIWSYLTEFVVPAIDTSVTGTVEYYWYNGVTAAWNSSDVSQYSITQWNDTTLSALQTINNNWYANIWVYAEADDTTMALVYPQSQYPSSAQASAEAPPTLIPTHIKEHGILIGRIIIKQREDAPVSVENVSSTTFNSSVATDHGNLTGLSDDDHPQYGALAQDEIVTGAWTFTPEPSDITAIGINHTYTGSSSIKTQDVDIDIGGTVSDDRTNYAYYISMLDTQGMALGATAKTLKNYGINIDLDSTGNHDTGTAIGSIGESIYSIFMDSVLGPKTISGVNPGRYDAYGMYFKAHANNIVNATANNMIVSSTGVYLDVQTIGNINSGGSTTSATATGIGLRLVGDTGETGVTTTGYGIYAAVISDFDVSWAYYNGTISNNFFGGDNVKNYIGDGKDASIYFDGSDLIVNSENITANDEIHFTNFSLYSFDEDISTTGNVTGANLNVSNWDTAYGWGDWSGEGFITGADVPANETDPTVDLALLQSLVTDDFHNLGGTDDTQPSSADLDAAFCGTDGKILGRSGGTWQCVAAGAASPGGADTQVQYNNGGVLGGTSGFVWDDVNSRVGIGFAAPATILEVAGTLRVSQTGDQTDYVNISSDVNPDAIQISNSEGTLFYQGPGQYASTAIGLDSGLNLYGSGNIFMGWRAGYTNAFTTGQEGNYNCYIGYRSGYGSTVDVDNTGSYNVGLGGNTLYKNTIGINNMAIGFYAMGQNTSGANNVAVGVNALYSNQTGGSNMAIGFNSNATSTADSYNVNVGNNALRYLNGGGYNVAIGDSAGNGVNGSSTFSSNVIIGRQAGYGLTSATTNVLIGNIAGYGLTSGSSNIFIGYYAGRRQTTNSNLLIIDNQARASTTVESTNAILYGVMAAAPANQSLSINAATLNLRSGADTDLVINFLGTTNSGLLNWMEDENYFKFSDDIMLLGGENIVLDTSTGTKIGTATTQLLGFYNAAPVDQPTALSAGLTTVTYTEPGTPDYAIQNLTQTTPYGFVTSDEAQTLLKTVANLQTKVAELEARLEELGLVASN